MSGRTIADLTAEAIPVLARAFWSEVEVTEGCWWWTGRRNRDGYGLLTTQGLGLGLRQTILAHRFSYYLANAYWPTPLARHLCHNPGCVCSGHLVQGTHQDNANDNKLRRAGVDLLAFGRTSEHLRVLR